MVGAERIAENAHWTSDVVAAALLGVFGAKLVWWTCDRIANALREESDVPLVSSPSTPGEG
jgi:membrane-associated phospholipid phosphatase